jgi:choice-of-anchor C domain-containing protein
MNRSFLTAAALTLVASAANAQNIVSNGSFELPALNAGTNWTTYGVGTGIPNWTITNGSVDLIRSYWQAADGSQSLDMNGNSPATISQMLSTQIGSTYNLSFFLAGNPDGRFDKQLNVYWNNVLVGGTAQTFVQGSNTHASMGWTQLSFAGLTANAASTELRFEGLDSGTAQDHPSHAYIGAALDDVSVQQNVAIETTATPEPASLALMATGLVAIGGFVRRRRQA